MEGYLTFGGVEDLNPGVGGVQSRTLPTRFTMSLMGMRSPSSTGAQSNSRSAAPSAGVDEKHMDSEEMGGLGGSPVAVWIGFALLLIAFHFVRRSQESLQANLLGVNLFNLLVITITAILGITLFKVAFSKVAVPGVSQLVHSV